MKENKLDRLKQLNILLTTLDAPKEGDEVLFTLEGQSIKYRGVVKRKTSSNATANYRIVSKTKPAPVGIIDTIEYKGRVFKIKKVRSL